MEAAPAVDGLGARRLRSLLTEFVSTQSAAEPRVCGLVLFIESSCEDRRREGGELLPVFMLS